MRTGKKKKRDWKWIAFLASAGFLIVICAASMIFAPDLGACLADHEVTEVVQTGSITIGDISTPTYGTEQRTVCDQWEFPNGRPEPKR